MIDHIYEKIIYFIKKILHNWLPSYTFLIYLSKSQTGEILQCYLR